MPTWPFGVGKSLIAVAWVMTLFLTVWLMWPAAAVSSTDSDRSWLDQSSVIYYNLLKEAIINSCVCTVSKQDS